MAYKIRAYQYIKETNTFRKITQKFLLSLSKHDRGLFIEKNKPFYFEDSLDSLKMTFNRLQKTFRFYPKINQRIYASDEESCTHLLCKEVICEMNELSLKLKDYPKEICKFEYKYSFEELPLYSKNGDCVIPDVLIYFKKPCDLGYKWNRTVAIEVKVTSRVKEDKIEKYKELKIPVIQITANKKWGTAKEYEMSEEERKKLKNWIKNSFKKGFTADVLLDTKSKSYFENKLLNECERKITNLKEELEFTEKIHLDIKAKLNDSYKLNSRTDSELVDSKQKLIELKKKYDTLKRKHICQKTIMKYCSGLILILVVFFTLYVKFL